MKLKQNRINSRGKKSREEQLLLRINQDNNTISMDKLIKFKRITMKMMAMIRIKQTHQNYIKK